MDRNTADRGWGPSQSGTAPPSDDPTSHRQILTVSELTARIKRLLEDSFPFIWVTGEVSNFRMPSSGHHYFVLKDEDSQISAVMFRGQNRNLRFEPEDGMTVTGMGRIGVYEPRGTYQVIFEYMEPKGIGAIQVAFEQLKKRLAAEGLFDEKHKKPLPFLPARISIITSPTGAVVHDILRIVKRRFPNMHIQIIPVKVQGENAEDEIVSAIKVLNDRADSDVAILARGGGSIEDLNAFNAENVARAVYASEVPIVSAVGHETDFTIADFVADLRAPTPSAAAELTVPVKMDLSQRCAEVSAALYNAFKRSIEQHRLRLGEMSKRLRDPRKRLEDLRLKVDDLSIRFFNIYKNSTSQRLERLEWWTDRLYANNPITYLERMHTTIEQYNNNMLTYLRIITDAKRATLQELEARLHTLDPAAILSRGYSITRRIPDAAVVKDPASVDIDQDLEITVQRGTIVARVRDKEPGPDGREEEPHGETDLRERDEEA